MTDPASPDTAPDGSPPDLGVVAPGRSALSAFLPIEAWARERVSDARAAAEQRLTDAETEAAALRDQGEQRMREAVIEGEQDALRQVEDHAQDRVGYARRAVDAWIADAEQRFDILVGQAVDLLTAPPPGVPLTGGDPRSAHENRPSPSPGASRPPLSSPTPETSSE